MYGYTRQRSLIGRKAVETDLTGTARSAVEARSFRLVNYVEDSDGIENRVATILDEMRHVSPTSNASFHRIHGSLITAPILNVAYKELLRTITSPDFRTGATAFTRKEPPEYDK